MSDGFDPRFEVAEEHASVAARAAVQSLREVRDAYRAVEDLLHIPVAHEIPALMVERERLTALMRLINGRFVADLASAEAAIQAC